MEPQFNILSIKKIDEFNYSIQLAVTSNKHEFKITRGNWSNTECNIDGSSIANHVFTNYSDTTLYLKINAWQDDFVPIQKKHTASSQVKILDKNFYIPQLHRYRKIWVYLPKNYSSKNKYPVLYLNDGQNIFDEATSFSGEWGVDEFLDSTKLNTCIVVAIDNGGLHRMTEYNPFDHLKFGKSEGKNYISFIVNTLKPYIDKKFSTKKNPANTIIAGSSMGGLIAYYALLQFPQIFGKGGIFSPSFWICKPQLLTLTKQKIKTLRTRYFFIVVKKKAMKWLAICCFFFKPYIKIQILK